MTRISCEEVINLFRQYSEIGEKIGNLASAIVSAENEARSKNFELSTYSDDDSVELVEYKGKQIVCVVVYSENNERYTLECSIEEFVNPLLYYGRRLNDQKAWDLWRQESERKEDLAMYMKLKAKLGL